MGIKILGSLQERPSTVKSDNGQRNGVGKNCAEWVGMSMRMCKPQGNMR